MVVQCRAPAPSDPSHLSRTLHARNLPGDYELGLPQERAKYAMLGGSEVVVGTSIAPCDLMHASWCCGGPLPRPRPLQTLTPLLDSPRDLPGDYELRLPQERAKYAMLGGS